VTDHLESELDRAYALGRANLATMELARRHCLHMTFTEWGGRGWAEQASGLPINTRQVSCPVARGNSAAMNLDWIVSDFYDRHCVGCQRRRPTGEVPNLASVMDARKAQAAAATEADQRATDQRHREWEQRAEHRRAVIARADPAMTGALGDIAVLDREPGAPDDRDAVSGALGRLTALADRAPQTFTVNVVDLAIRLVEQVGVTALLGPLRHLARRRPDVAPAVLSAALSALGSGPAVEAGRCIADLASYLAAADVRPGIARSLIMLAGMPGEELPFRRSRSGAAQDPSGLRAAAGIAPETVIAGLRGMLPAPARRSPLLVPPGTSRGADGREVSDFDRICAANAAQAMAGTHPDIASHLAESLISNLGVDNGDSFDTQPVVSVQHALATMQVLGIGDVTARLERAGRAAGSEVRDRLFGVAEQTARLLDPDDRWREPGDPQPGPDRRRAIFDQILATCLTRAGGDWGDRTRHAAANLADDLAGIDPAWAFGHVSAFLGAFLTAIGQLSAVPASSLILVGDVSPQERATDTFSRQTSITSAAQRLLSAVEKAAAAGPVAVCGAVTALIAEERDTDRGPEVVWRLLPVLGRIGQRHGAEPSVLAAILPTLHTYIVDSEASLRSAALTAWAEIGVVHRLPSSVADLLPALLADRSVGVIRAVLAAARSLTWSDDDRIRLFVFTSWICASVDADRGGQLLRDAMATLDALAGDDDWLRAHAEALILRRAADLDGYDLRNVLRRSWSPQAARSADMAALRLRQARDPAINDRINYRGDPELCALLDCGPGLAALPAGDLAAAAAELAPDSLIGCAEFAEVAWRAGRPADAVAVMRTVADVIPAQPAYDSHRAITQVLIDAADLDVAAENANGIQEAARRLIASVATAGASAGDFGASLARQVRARVTARFLLAGHETPAGLTVHEVATTDGTATDQAGASRQRADRIAAAGEDLEALSERATVTAAYIRLFAGLCGVAAHLLRYDAAELDADPGQAAAHQTAARRRAELLEADLAGQFTADDPLASRLRAALAAVSQVSGGAIAQVLASWAALPLPVLIVSGRRPIRRPARDDDAATDGEARSAGRPVAVVLASVDGQLVTGPQVLQPATVYELRLEVRPGAWPDWADRLDAELISHLTPQESETPAFSWKRPSAASADDILTGDGTLILRFGLGADRPAPPFLIAMRWRGTRDGEPVTEIVDVAGHRELRLRPFDASRDFLTDFPVFDERLLTLYEQLHGAGYDEDQLQAFCRLFTAVCRAGLKIMWDPRYKGGTTVSEKEFHDDLCARLQGEAELGGRLERGSKLGLGFLDVRHDGITAELKVERRIPVSQEAAPKYMGQPTQYAAADGARLSILCVLDMSRKTSPVGVPENYMFTLQPALHGLINPEAPSLVAVIVINGNQPPPSSWSRRKAAVQPPQGGLSASHAEPVLDQT